MNKFPSSTADNDDKETLVTSDPTENDAVSIRTNAERTKLRNRNVYQFLDPDTLFVNTPVTPSNNPFGYEDLGGLG